MSSLSVGNGLLRDREVTQGRPAGPIADNINCSMGLLLGPDAEKVLADPDFLAQWKALQFECPWSTVFQSIEFSTLWYSVYIAEFEPVLVVGRGIDGHMVGLLLLARDRCSNALVCVGTHHAEYHTWLATPSYGEEFIREALVLISFQLKPIGTLHFLFLAPNTPTSWCKAVKIPNATVSVLPQQRPLLEFDLMDVSSDSLQKKSNKTKLSRVNRIGPVRVVSIQTAEEFEEVIDRIVDFCDFRQCAIHDSTPFESDVHKKHFYRGLMAAGRLSHMTVLYAGDTLLAAHIGIVNKDSVVLGLIAHSPIHSRHSPGKLLLLSISKLMSEQGFRFFDLTPGGDYKENFANTHDEVHVLEVTYGRVASTRYVLRRTLIRIAKSTTKHLPVSATSWPRVRALSTSLSRIVAWRFEDYARAPVKVLNLLRRRLWSEGEFRTYRIDSAGICNEVGGEKIFSRNSLADLMRYVPSSLFDPPRSVFLREAMRRLEEGQVVYTLTRDGILVYYSWLQLSTSLAGSEYGHQIPLPENSAVLWDDFTHPSGRGQGLHQLSIRTRLAEVAVMEPPRFAYVGIRAENGPSRHNYEKLGFQHWSSAWIQVRFGRVRRWLDGVT